MSDITINKENTLRFVSWNVKGLNSPVKRGKIFSHLKHLKTDIAFLQETHLTLKDHHRLKASWVGQSFHSKFSSKSRGAAIILHKKVQFIPNKIVPDLNGRFIIVTGSLYNKNVALINLYAPNNDDESFFQKI